MKSDRREFLRVVSLGTAGLLAGCDRKAPNAVDPDAGMSLLDSGQAPVEPTPDAGSEPFDAGTPDAGATPDAGIGMVDTPEVLPLSDEFPLGVTSGDVSGGAAVLTTLYTDVEPLRLLVWRLTGTTYTRVANVKVVAGDAGYLRAEVSGLAPGGVYRYAFVEERNGELARRSPIGQFRAPPADDEAPTIILGASSCTKDPFPMGAIENAGKRQDLHAFLLLGDTSYCDGSVSLADYRRSWAKTLGSSAYRTLRSNMSVIGTWDDHECVNNFTMENVPAAQIAAARQAFLESLPVRRPTGEPDRMWRSIRFGRTAEVFMLDSRSDRRPSRGEYIGRAQMDWLKAGLMQSNAVFKIIAHSVPITQFPFTTEMEDTWRAFPAQRTEILSHIDDNKIPGVLWLTGDHHFGCIAKVAPSGVGSTQLEILAGPGAQLPNSDYSKCTGPQFEYVTALNNYVALHLNPQARTVRVVFHNTFGGAFADRTYTV